MTVEAIIQLAESHGVFDVTVKQTLERRAFILESKERNIWIISENAEQLMSALTSVLNHYQS